MKDNLDNFVTKMLQLFMMLITCYSNYINCITYVTDKGSTIHKHNMHTATN